MTSPGSNEIRLIVGGENNMRPVLNAAARDMNSFQTEQIQQYRQFATRLARLSSQGGQKMGEGIADGARDGMEHFTRDVNGKLRDARGRFVSEGKRAGKGFADGVEDGTDKIKPEMEDAGEGAGGGFKDAALAGAAGLVAGLAALGLAAGAALAKGVSSAIDAEADHDKLAAQLGLTERESKRAGEISGRIYANAYGESLADVDSALRFVSTNIADLRKTSNADVESMTKKALDLATAYELDVGESTRAVGKLIRTGLVKDATEGFDLITAGMRSGVDEAGDLLDTFSEYSTQFRDLGISGPKALGLMSQALKAGARDADTVADAIKEFAIRSKDGSEASATAFEALGYKSEAMFKVFAEGGPKADTAMADVIRRIKAMKDPVEQDATAVGLFGTKAEDLQDALYALDPTTAVASLGQIKGAADDLGETLGDNFKTKIESFKRSLEMGMMEAGEGVLDFFKDISESKGAQDFMKGFREDVMPILRSFTKYISGTVVPAVKEFVVKWLGQGATALKGLREAVAENRPELERLVNTAKAVAKVFLQIATSEFATSGLKFAISSVTVFINVLGKVGPAIRVIIAAGAQLAIAMIGTFGKILNGAAWAFGWVPGIGPKLKEARNRFRDFASGATRSLAEVANAALGIKSPTIRPRVDLSSFYARMRELRGQLNAIQYANAGRYSAPTGKRTGGIIGAATGGVHGGMRLVGEEGPEFVSLPTGSTVFPASTTSAMAARGGAGGEVVIRVDLTGADRLLLEWIRSAARVQGGGNVQLAFGRGS